MVDPNYHLAHILHLMFKGQAQELAVRLTLHSVEDGVDPDLSHWSIRMATALKPTMLQIWQRGMVGGMRRVIHHVRPHHTRRVVVPLHTGGRLHLDKSWDIAKAKRKPYGSVGVNFSLSNPRILDAVDALTLKFCRETNDNIIGNLKDGLAEIRQALKRGLPRGQAQSVLHHKINKVVADPYRAWRITVTESARANAAGELMSYRDSGVVGKKAWLASFDACDRCQELDGKEVDLDKPFTVLPEGGPYAVIDHNPLHPHCACQIIPILE